MTSSWDIVMSRAVNLTNQELGLRYKWDRTVFVTNLSYDCKWPALKDFMKENVGEVSYCDVFEENGKSSGTAAVEFKSVEHARNACRLTLKLLNRKLSVFLDEDGKRTRRAVQQALVSRVMSGKTNNIASQLFTGNFVRRTDRGDQRGHRTTSFTSPSSTSIGFSHVENRTSGNAVHRSPSLQLRGRSSTRAEELPLSLENTQARLYALLHRLGVEGEQLSDRVVVTNLDDRITKQKLYDVFSLAGQVLEISLLSEQKSSSQSAVIQFDRVVDALQAIAMLDGQYLYERRLVIRLNGSTLHPNSPPLSLPAGLSGVGERLNIEELLLCHQNSSSSDPFVDQIDDISIRKRTAEVSGLSSSTNRLFNSAAIDHHSTSVIGSRQYSSASNRRQSGSDSHMQSAFAKGAFSRGRDQDLIVAAAGGGDDRSSRSQQQQLVSKNIYDDLRRRLKQPRLSTDISSNSGNRSLSKQQVSNGMQPNRSGSTVVDILPSMRQGGFDDAARSSYSSRMRSAFYHSGNLNRSDSSNNHSQSYLR
ncbi:hypothetical protein GJ496_009651 [Pomphorhynchus laevis]|nr:hypothetical protein GJ496_009651 [Pomphorhynchus laevis]